MARVGHVTLLEHVFPFESANVGFAGLRRLRCLDGSDLQTGQRNSVQFCAKPHFWAIIPGRIGPGSWCEP